MGLDHVGRGPPGSHGPAWVPSHCSLPLRHQRPFQPDPGDLPHPPTGSSPSCKGVIPLPSTVGRAPWKRSRGSNGLGGHVQLMASPAFTEHQVCARPWLRLRPPAPSSSERRTTVTPFERRCSVGQRWLRSHGGRGRSGLPFTPHPYLMAPEADGRPRDTPLTHLGCPLP